MDEFELVEPRQSGQTTECPIQRSGHCMVSDDAHIYIFGGYNKVHSGATSGSFGDLGPACTVVELWKYNHSTRKWKEINAIGTPDTCASSCLHMCDQQLYVYGGTGYPFGHMMSNTIKVCDLRIKHPESGQKYSWNLVETNPNIYDCTDKGDQMPRRGYGQSMIFHEDGIYIFAGAIGLHEEPVADLHKLNLYTMSWEELSPTGNRPGGRYKQEIAKDHDRFYVFGGGRLSSAETLERIYTYHFEKNHWDIIQTIADPIHGYPKPRCSFGLIQVGKDIYICGGRHYTIYNEHESLSDMWKYSLESCQWKYLPVRLPEPLFFHAVTFAPSGHMYLFGGVKCNDQRSDRLYKWRVPYFLPKLSEICWDKLMQSYDSLHHVNLTVLHSIGIPWTFSHRLDNR